jgi:hypothetical protein
MRVKEDKVKAAVQKIDLDLEALGQRIKTKTSADWATKTREEIDAECAKINDDLHGKRSER